jgi:hypothetical protein
MLGITTNVAERPDRLQLSIAGIGIELTWEGTWLAEEPTWKFYEAFVAKGHQPPHAGRLDARWRVHCGKLPTLKADGMIFDARPNRWRLFRSSARYALEVFSTTPPHPRTQLAVMSSDFRAGEVHIRPDGPSPNPSWSLTQLMRPFGELLMINLLSQGHGVLLHALGVNDRGEGLLFVGASGAGKTTLGDLYQRFSDVTVLGDERVVVTWAGGQFWLSGTPWPGGGFTVSAETVPLRKVFFLEHGPCNALIADAHLTLYGLLFQQLFLSFWSREALAFAMRFGEELLSTVPAARLAFVNDARVIEFLRSQVMSDG